MINNQLKSNFLNHNFDNDGAEQYFDKLQLYREMIMRYECAILEVQTKLQVLNNDMSVRYKRNPIESVKTRIKSPLSIVEKLNRHGFDVTVDSMMQNLNDVAGVRVICSFIDDIYEIAKMLARQDDIKVIEIKDYIKSPKENGYRSYHMIIEIPVFFSDKTMNMRVEIQLRTIAMDSWASVEHDLKYKKDDIWDKDISNELLECAQIIHETDVRMMDIRNRMDKQRLKK